MGETGNTQTVMKLSELNTRLVAIEQKVDILLPPVTPPADPAPPADAPATETTETTASADYELPPEIEATIVRLESKLASVTAPSPS
jgi:hypothetical protein